MYLDNYINVFHNGDKVNVLILHITGVGLPGDKLTHEWNLMEMNFPRCELSGV